MYVIRAASRARWTSSLIAALAGVFGLLAPGGGRPFEEAAAEVVDDE